MKREVIFKAKSVETGEWVEGDLVHYVTGTCIRVERVNHSAPVAKLDYIDIEVDPATVCQFTGLLDSKGVRIFEGDKERHSGDVVRYRLGAFYLHNVKDDRFGDWLHTYQITIDGSIHDSEATK